MATLYFLGGERVWKRDSQEINARAFFDAGGSPAVLVFPWARSSFDKSYFQRTRLCKYFKSLGASNVDFAEYSDSFSELIEKVEFSDLIYLTGGLTSVLLERMRNKNVDNLLREYGKVIVGRSAGALVLCNRCILTRNRKRPATVAISGIRLVDFSVKVHYNPLKDNQLKLLSKEEKIYAIPEGLALVYADGSLESIGNVYLFQNGEKTRAD
jgi:dipeptidase E